MKMTELGYVEGKNIVYDVQTSELNLTIDEQILKKFVHDKVDLIFVLPTEAAVKAKEVTQGTSIPVLFANSNIEGVDLVNSIREPGNNITGVRYPGPDLTVKRFEIMCEIAPHIKRIWVPYKRGLAIVPSQLEVLRTAALVAGVSLIESPADDVKEIQAILRQHERSRKPDFDAILMIAEPLAVTPVTFIEMGKVAAKYKIPIGGALMMVDGVGSIFGVSTDNIAVGKQAAPLADKILKGTPAGTIPVVSAENFLQINCIVAQQLGVKVPDGLLKQADKVIAKDK
jgi:putative ABC transport system substrate-binding protein